MQFALNTSNPLLQLVYKAKKTPHSIVALLLSLVFVIVGQLLGYLVIELFPNNLFKSSIWNAAFNEFKEILFPFLFIIVVIFFWVKFYEKRNFSTLGFTKDNFCKKLGIGLIAGVVMFSSAIAFLYFTNNLATEKSFNSTYVFPSLLILLSYFVQGSTEEIVFRGWLLPVLAKKLHPWLAIMLSSIMFALLHALNDNITIFAIINLLLFGIFISLLALRQASIIGVCIWHAMWNWLQGNFFGLQVSGNQEGISILNFKETGEDWITGGEFGPEGGFVITIILLLGIGILFIINRKPKK